jgi:phage-related protein
MPNDKPARCVGYSPTEARRPTGPLYRALWELRLKGKDGIARGLYVTTSGQRVVVVRIFTKKTQKAPRKQIELALKRAAQRPLQTG